MGLLVIASLCLRTFRAYSSREATLVLLSFVMPPDELAESWCIAAGRGVQRPARIGAKPAVWLGALAHCLPTRAPAVPACTTAHSPLITLSPVPPSLELVAAACVIGVVVLRLVCMVGVSSSSQ